MKRRLKICAGMGGLFAAIYIRSGNLFVCMVAHGLTDFIAFLDGSQVGEGGVMTATLGVQHFIDLALCCALMALGLYLDRFLPLLFCAVTAECIKTESSLQDDPLIANRVCSRGEMCYTVIKFCKKGGGRDGAQ